METQSWSCRDEEPGGEYGKVRKLGERRIFCLIASFVIMENCCTITLRFHGRQERICRELTEVETVGMIWDSAPAWGGYSISATKPYSSASIGCRHLIY